MDGSFPQHGDGFEADRALRNFLLSTPDHRLLAHSREKRDRAWGSSLTYSRKVFIPLTRLCRDVCHYCTFATSPRRIESAYLSPDEAVTIAHAGKAAGCKEALFTLGDKPELRYEAARAHLDALGFSSTLHYLAHVAERVLRETGLLPHLNPGLMEANDVAMLRSHAASMGLMLESSSERLCEKGGPHFGSPDKAPRARLQTLSNLGASSVPTTTGLLVGIGETRKERIESLLAIRDLHARYQHIQEVIVQNFRAKASTRMARSPEPAIEELLWTVAAARLVLEDSISVQAPPNLNAHVLGALIDAGVNDWGGISPVTIDHVNPECAWPEIEDLAAVCADKGFSLTERLTVYPKYRGDSWLDPIVRTAVRVLSGGDGLAREGPWAPGEAMSAPADISAPLRDLTRGGAGFVELDALASGGGNVLGIAKLFAARGDDARFIVRYADALRRERCGDTVTYVVNRNINYTNICSFSCSFCAFSKTSAKAGLRDKPYAISPEEVARRALEAAAAGATEVCLQGGIHPDYKGDTYRSICRAVKTQVPDLHIHAFSPLEISHGAATLGLSAADFLTLLKEDGLASLPGTAAEILNDDVRAVLCPDKLTSARWLEIVRAAHLTGLRTTATIMFGHVDEYAHWAQHLLQIRDLQRETHGFTEFVPLPFVHMQAPIFLRGIARAGPTWRECVLMHAIARIVLNGEIDNIQASWVKLGVDGAVACLAAGANDIGGVLMNESISRAAGAAHGQSLDLPHLVELLAPATRPLAQRTTFYAIHQRNAPLATEDEAGFSSAPCPTDAPDPA